jgi:thiamine-monophosphate kinase
MAEGPSLASTLIIVNRSAPGEPGFTEDELIAAIRKVLSGGGPGVVVGAGDDAAVVRPGAGDAVFTADMLVEGVHFERALTSSRDLGMKAIAANVSDVAAMGASPRHAVVSLALTDRVDAAWVMDLYGGMLAACEEYAATLVGGDLSRGPAVVLSVALTGEVPTGLAILRSGARPGHRLVVTGTVGAAAGGLALARAPVADMVEALASGWGRMLLDRQFRPTARVGEGQTLAQCGASAMIDVSDGLSLDLSRLCEESAVGALVTTAAIPVAPELHELGAVLPVDPLGLALGGGEDYELLAAMPPEAVEEAGRLTRERFGVPLADIGVITEGRGLVSVDEAGRESVLRVRGWDHFASR